jgi:hypothetical protein
MSRKNPIIEKIKTRIENRCVSIRANNTEIARLQEVNRSLAICNDGDRDLIGERDEDKPSVALPKRTRKARKTMVETTPEHTDPGLYTCQTCGWTGDTLVKQHCPGGKDHEVVATADLAPAEKKE